MLRILSFFILLFLSSQKVFAEPYIPEQLKPWVQWVLEESPDRNCSLLGNVRACQWPSSLAISARSDGADFNIEVTIENKALLQLPGNEKNWPQEISVEGLSPQNYLVQRVSDLPYLELEKGSYKIKGKFYWQEMPKEIQVPTITGLLKLEVNGKAVKNPLIANSGSLWLEGVENLIQVEADTLDISVARKLSEELPFAIQTWLNLKISGKSREFKINDFLPRDSEVVEIQSVLANAFDISTNTLSVQLKPGNYQIYIKSLLKQPPSSLLAIKVDNKFWPESEIWSYQQNENLRVVDIEGVDLINTSQVELPEEWKNFPSYLMNKDSEMKLAERARGQIDVPINSLNLTKNVWLDLSGKGFTFEDRFSGNIYRDWRLNILAPFELTRAAENNQDLLITTDPVNHLNGVELRNSGLDLYAVSRMNQFQSNLPLVGWDTEVSSLSMNLMLGPGWSLLHASGLNAPSSWVSSWSLWHVFTICLISIVAYKTYSKKWGILVFLLLVICHSQTMSPQYFILNLIIAKALATYLKQDSIKKYFTGYYLYSLTLFVIISFIFIVRQVRIGLFPQLERFNYGVVLEVNFLYVFIYSLSALVILYLFIKAIICFFSKEKLKAFFLLFVCGVSFFVIGGILSAVSYYPFGSGVSTSYAPAIARSKSSKVDHSKTYSKMIASPQAYEDRAFGEAGDASNMALDEKMAVQQTKILRQVDPNSKLQTGAALPNWNWSNNSLYSSGPVNKNKMLTLFLLSPAVNLLLCLLRIVLLLLILKSINLKELFTKSLANLGVTVFLLMAPTLFSATAKAEDIPSSEILTQLKDRLNRDRCLNDCVTTEHLEIDIKGNQLTLSAKVHSLDAAAWLSPGPVTQFNPQAIQIDGQKSAIVRRDERNLFWIKLDKGSHQVVITGDLSGNDLLNLNFFNNPGFVKVNAPEWTVDGLSATGNVQGSLQFLRKETRSKENNEIGKNKTSELSQWYVVNRKLYIDMPWEVETEVKRIGSLESATIVKIPLLEGEEIISESFKVDDGKVEVNIPRGKDTASWSSRFKINNKLELKAEEGSNLSEIWELNCSAIFQCNYSGANPISKSSPVVVWNPWPGEKVSIEVRKPEGVKGIYQTIDQADLAWTPGDGIARANLSMTLRSSQKGYQTIKISPDAKIESLLVNGLTRNVVVDKGEIQLPLEIGEQQIQILWQQPWEYKLMQEYPAVDLGGEVNNLHLTTTVSESRWLLYACGPKWGPVIMFWGNVLAVILMALIFSKLKIIPLTFVEWAILGLGLIFVHPLTILLFALYFLVLTKKSLLSEKSAVVYNFVQIFLVIMTVVNLLILFFSIYNGLVLKPSMSISGDGSYEYLLSWYVDRFNNQLPKITVLSLPIWTWRSVMLIWSTWLVLALIRWAKWSWENFELNGIWKKVS
ncbi:MAG: oligosaccharide repeat unit polymerase [Proteobacteria bacterium]|nr:oligosaccharide repeat unit polymerase [Pseudomonadota bacterium]